MKFVLAITAAAFLLGGCAEWIDWPDGPADRTQRSDAKSTAEHLCPNGEVVVRPGSDGKTQGDYYCKRKRKKDD